MRFTFVILLFLSLGADAQMIIKAHANYRPYAVAAQNLLLDDYPNAAAAYSLRKLDKDYTGSAIRVRRSNDNSEQDIGFVGDNLDTASLKTFVGANSGFVTTWYSQGDSTAVNFTQTTAASQPRIVNAGTVERRNGKPSVFFDGSNDFMDVDNSTAKFNYIHGKSFAKSMIAGVVQYGTSNNPNATYILLNNNATSLIATGFATYYADNFGDNDVMYNAVNGGRLGSSQNYYTPNSLRLFTLEYYLDITNSIIFRFNGGNQITRTALTDSKIENATNNLRMGRISNGSSFPMLGYVSEIVIYPSNQSSNRTGIETNINSYYVIY
jgi:hypothetical protein